MSNNETAFEVERSADNKRYAVIWKGGANVTTYSDTGLVSNNTYYYRVRASNTAGYPAYSNVGSAKTLRK